MRYKFLLALIIGCIFINGVTKSYAGGWLIYSKPEFKGKVIDAETKEPIEGAVVVAVYSKQAIRIEPESVGITIDVKESLTDKDGDFRIPSYITIIDPFAWSKPVTFIIFKPGYGSFPNDYEFQVFPVKNVNVLKSVKWKDPNHIESIEQGIEKEGIIFWKPHWFKIRKWNINTRPFLPLDDAEHKARSLAIPFDYEIDENDIDNVWNVWNRALPETFKNYTVVGLKKLKTREERLRAIPGISGDPSYST
ncbi:MAG: hypothetical protein AAB257_06635, partial [Nitrospinota bacterium]